MNTILVSSHRRSGTHFLIDSLRRNIDSAEFPNHYSLPADFNIGSLFSKQEKVYAIFNKLIDSPTPVIIKSHLLPEECNIQTPRDKYEVLIKEIFDNSRKLYIYREGQPVLISLYKFLKPACSFSEFIREENDHIVKEIRRYQDFDANRVRYWSHHIRQWQLEASVKHVSFSDLLTHFPETMEAVLNDLGFDLPATLEKPGIPKNLFLHGIQKKLYSLGLGALPENSSVRPNKGSKTIDPQYFSELKDEAYYQNQKGELQVD
ncbi:MAG: hypothetical protein HQ507_01155 [Candidatus Marinimicrobia bacterium]|nr:hypothetical protein [Candidatus Neomarinimicrobiota bacterium]